MKGSDFRWFTKPPTAKNKMHSNSDLVKVPLSLNLGRGVVLRISSDRDDRRIVLGLKFSIPGLFWVEKFGKFFFVWLDLSSYFLEYSKLSEDSW